jgi:hypothetical protein
MIKIAILGDNELIFNKRCTKRGGTGALLTGL